MCMEPSSPPTHARRVKRPTTAAPSFAIATVTRNPHRFGAWLDYYRRLGAAHVFLAVEQSPDVVAYCEAHAAGFVTLSVASEQSNPYFTLIDRQEAHVNAALAGCAVHGVDWLFHVDDDELLHFCEPWEEVARRVPRDADCLVLTNVEAVPDHAGSDFTTISRFFLDDDLFLCYVNGKAGGRVGSTAASGSHRFTGVEWLVPLESAMLMHFESCPYGRWRDKFMHYASLQRKMSDIPFRFYVDSILACRRVVAERRERERRNERSAAGLRSSRRTGVARKMRLGSGEAALRGFWRRRKLLHYTAHPGAIVTVRHLALRDPAPGRVETRGGRGGRAAPAAALLCHWGERRNEGLNLDT